MSTQQRNSACVVPVDPSTADILRRQTLTIGWRRPDNPPTTVDVPFTAGFIEQLHRRRYDLGHTNIDRVSQETWDQAVVDRDREAAITLDRLLARG